MTFRLRIVDGGRAGEVLPLAPGSPVVLGRGHEATLRFGDDGSMSRVHADLSWDGEAWVLRNRSQHGTRVGPTTVQTEARLVPGDSLKLGTTHLVFELVPEDGLRGSGTSPAARVNELPPPSSESARRAKLSDRVLRADTAPTDEAPAAPSASAPAPEPALVQAPGPLPPRPPARRVPAVPAPPPAGVAPGAVAPEGAGYDEDGVFHMGFTMLQPGLGDSPSQIILPAPGKGGVAIKKKTIYFFLVLLFFTSIGCCCGGFELFLPMLLKIPREFAIASSLALLPTVPYLWLYKFLDRNAQIPLRNYLACFLWGASVGCGFSVVANDFMRGALQSIVGGDEASNLLTSILGAPFFEESSKGLAVLVVFLILRDEFDNAVEGMILGAAAGLGFALVENCVYDSMFLVQGRDLQTFLFNGTFRALTCALVGHPVYTAMTGLGFGLAREVGRKSALRFLLPPLGWGLAVTMHALWNASAGILMPLIFKDRELAGMISLAVFVGGGGLAFFLAALTFALWKERKVLLGHLSDEVEKGFIEPAELENFKSLFGRERFVFGGVGKGTWKLRKRLRRAQLDLAFRKWHLEQGDAVKGVAVDRDLLDARIRIRDARNAINAREGRKRAPTGT